MSPVGDILLWRARGPSTVSRKLGIYKECTNVYSIIHPRRLAVH